MSEYNAEVVCQRGGQPFLRHCDNRRLKSEVRCEPVFEVSEGVAP